jgi:hypothetical protein
MSAKDMTLLSSKTRLTRTTRRRFKSNSSCGQDSAALYCPTFLSFKILQLAWRLVCLAAKEAAQCGPQTCGQEA